MSSDADRLLEVAAALADGESPEWLAFDAVDPRTSGTLHRLKSIERLSDAFRKASAAAAAEAIDERHAPPLFTWGHLEVMELLGTGSYGEVYRAWDPVLHRDVALKLLRTDMASGPANEFQVEEGRRLAQIRHPGVLAVHGAAVHGGRAGVWGDLIRGQTLEQILSTRGRFGASEVVAIGVEVCRALAALHGAGIVHGDIKATNVMREEGGRIVLMDLGAGRRIGAVGGLVYGTAAAAAPEVLDGASPSAASDLYSLGALLFRLLAARYHREGGGVRSLRDLCPDVPPAVVPVIERALAPDPVNRFPSAGAMGEALQHAVHERAKPNWRAGVIAAAFVAALAAVFFAARDFPWVSPREYSLHVGRLRQFGGASGSIPQAAFSPDGRRVAFVSDASGSPQVWVQDIAGGSPRKLTDANVWLSQPAWTPDGQRILFTTWRRIELLRGVIQAVSPEGGDPVTILDNAWNPNVGRRTGTIVFERSEEVWTSSADGSNARKLAGIPERHTRVSERGPVFSPDEALVAFVHAIDRPWGDVWVVPADGGAARQLTIEGKAVGRPAWSADGRAIVFASRASGTITLWQVDVRRALADGPRPPQRLTGGEGDETAPAVSPDGRSLLFSVAHSNYSLALVDPVRGTERRLRESRRPLQGPEVSRDGRIAFHGWGLDGGIHVYAMDADGGNIVQVTSGANGEDEGTFPVWSADGRDLFFYSGRTDPSWRRVPARGGESQVVKAGWTAVDRHMIKLDRIGRHAVYTWQERDTPRVTRIVDLQTGAEREFHHLLRYPTFTPDGLSLIGVDVAHKSFMRAGPLVVCALDGGPCRQLAPVGRHSRTSADGSVVYFQRPVQAQQTCEVWSVRIDGSQPVKLYTFTTEVPLLPAFDVTRSGELVVARFHKGRHELWLADLAK